MSEPAWLAWCGGPYLLTPAVGGASTIRAVARAEARDAAGAAKEIVMVELVKDGVRFQAFCAGEVRGNRQYAIRGKGMQEAQATDWVVRRPPPWSPTEVVAVFGSREALTAAGYREPAAKGPAVAKAGKR